MSVDPTTTKQRLVRYRIAGLSKEQVSQIDTILSEWGIAPRERERLIASAPILPTDSPSVGALKALGAGDRLAPVDIPEGEPDLSAPVTQPGRIEHIDTVRERFRQTLQQRGMSRPDAERVVQRARLTNPTEATKVAWERLVEAADQLGTPIPGVPAPTVEPDVFRQEWTDFLVSRGVSRPAAERLLRNTRFGANESPEMSWDRILEQAKVSRIKVGPVRTLAEAEATPDLLAPAEDELTRLEQFRQSPHGQATEAIGRRLSDAFNNLADVFERAPTPGGIAGPLTAMIILWFAFIPMLYVGSKAYTRLHLLFLATLGNAELNDPDRPDDKVIPPSALEEIAAVGLEAVHLYGETKNILTAPERGIENLITRGAGVAERLGQDAAHLIPGKPFGGD